MLWHQGLKNCLLLTQSLKATQHLRKYVEDEWKGSIWLCSIVQRVLIHPRMNPFYSTRTLKWTVEAKTHYKLTWVCACAFRDIQGNEEILTVSKTEWPSKLETSLGHSCPYWKISNKREIVEILQGHRAKVQKRTGNDIWPLPLWQASFPLSRTWVSEPYDWDYCCLEDSGQTESMQQ